LSLFSQRKRISGSKLVPHMFSEFIQSLWFQVILKGDLLNPKTLTGSSSLSLSHPSARKMPKKKPSQLFFKITFSKSPLSFYLFYLVDFFIKYIFWNLPFQIEALDYVFNFYFDCIRFFYFFNWLFNCKFLFNYLRIFCKFFKWLFNFYLIIWVFSCFFKWLLNFYLIIWIFYLIVNCYLIIWDFLLLMISISLFNIFKFWKKYLNIWEYFQKYENAEFFK
jgi:hypothetical protein